MRRFLHVGLKKPKRADFWSMTFILHILKLFGGRLTISFHLINLKVDIVSISIDLRYISNSIVTTE